MSSATDFKGKTISAVGWNAVSQISTVTLLLLQYAILARFLEKSDFGLMAIAMTFITFGLLFQDMGLGGAIFHKKSISQVQYCTLYWLNVCLSLLVVIFILSIGKPLSIFYHEPELSLVMMMLSSSFLLTALGRQPIAMAEKNMDFKLISIVTISITCISVATSSVLGYLGAGVLSLVYAHILKVGLTSAIMIVAHSRKMSLRLIFSYGKVKDILIVGFYDFLSLFINSLKTNLDVLLIGRLLGLEAAGVYDLAKRLAIKPFNFLNPLVMRVARPYLARMVHAEGDIIPSFKRILKLVSSMTLPAYIGMIVFSVPIVRIIYGTQYLAVSSVLIPLSLYFYVRSLINPVGAASIATGKTKFAFRWHVLSFPFMPIAVYFSAPYGPAAVGWSVFAMLVLTFHIFCRLLAYPVVGLGGREYIFAAIPHSPKSAFQELKRLRSARNSV